MKIKFDSHQDYQLEAIHAVMGVFDGQPRAQGEFEVQPDAFGGALLSQLGFGNNLVLDDDRILVNTQAFPPATCITSQPSGVSPGSRPFTTTRTSISHRTGPNGQRLTCVDWKMTSHGMECPMVTP